MLFHIFCVVGRDCYYRRFH